MTTVTTPKVKPNTLVYFVTQLHTCLHAEPDKSISHFIVTILLHNKMVTVCRFPMQQIPCKKTFMQILSWKALFNSYQSTESIENNWTDVRFPSKNGIQCTDKQACINIIFLRTVFGLFEFYMQIQKHFSKCESYLRERERERERERGVTRRVLDMPLFFFNWYTDFRRQFFGTICFYEDNSLPFCFGVAYCFKIRL